MTRTTLAILQVCRDLGIEVPDGECAIHRTRAGRWQRSAGAWSWWVEGPDGETVAASREPATAVLSAHRVGRVHKVEPYPGEAARELIVDPDLLEPAPPDDRRKPRQVGLTGREYTEHVAPHLDPGQGLSALVRGLLGLSADQARAPRVEPAADPDKLRRMVIYLTDQEYAGLDLRGQSFPNHVRALLGVPARRRGPRQKR